jgi:hypothetical protein
MAQDEDEKVKRAEDMRRTIATLRKGSPLITPRDLTEDGARKAREDSQEIAEGSGRNNDEEGLGQHGKTEDKEPGV